MQMRAIWIVGLICAGAASACASAGQSSEAGAPTEQRLLDATFMSNVYEVKKIVPASLAKVWAALPAAYDTLGIPILTSEPTVHAVANPGVKAHREFNHTALSRLIDCGETQIGPNADTYDVQLGFRTTLKEQGDSTLVTTVLDASARSPYAQGYARCTSKGILETRIADAIRKRVGG
jgi:hypothetical protein